MGIFGDIGRAFSGNSQHSHQREHTSPEADSTFGSPGQATTKVPPKVRIGRIENDTTGTRLNIYADLRNESDEPLVMTQIIVCGMQRQLGHQIRPGDVEQLLIYSGELIDDRPREFVELQYRLVSGNRYFESYYEIRSDPRGDEGYFITELRQHGPIRVI